MLVIVLSLVIVVLDQATKQWIRWHFNLAETRSVIDNLFNLTYLRNTGAAWGMFSGQNVLLLTLSVAVLFVLIFFRKRFMSDAWPHRVATGLLIGGILGNAIDRLRLGWVTDFLDFYIDKHHWPSFNIADSAICIGVAMYIVSSFWLHPEDEYEHVVGNGASHECVAGHESEDQVAVPEKMTRVDA